MRWRYYLQPFSRPSDAAGYILMAVVLIGIAVGLVALPNWPRWVDANRRTNYGFGADWACEQVAGPSGGTLICFKRPPIAAKQPAQLTGQP
jgi:hypothetical protein